MAVSAALPNVPAPWPPEDVGVAGAVEAVDVGVVVLPVLLVTSAVVGPISVLFCRLTSSAAVTLNVSVVTTSMNAQAGMAVPAGIGFGNL